MIFFRRASWPSRIVLAMATVGAACLVAIVALEGRHRADEVAPPVALSCHFGVCPPGAEVRLEVDLVNPTDQAYRIIGQKAACFKNGCLMATGLPIRVPGHQTIKVPVMLKAGMGGECDNELELFTDRHGYQATRVRVSGLVAGGEKTPDRPASSS